MTGVAFRCRCYWAERACPNLATQEDGLCDWCAPPGARTDEQLAANPKWADGTLGGGGEAHVDPTRTPDDCWMPGSGRTVEPLLQLRGWIVP